MDPRIDKHLAPASMQGSDETIDVRRYIEALRRARLPILLLVIIATVTAVVLSSVLPKQYKATARLVFEDTASTLGSSDTTAVERELATTDSLLTTPQVLKAATARIDKALAPAAQSRVTSAVDDSANIINVSATDRTPKGAATIANAVSESFIADAAEPSGSVSRRLVPGCSGRSRRCRVRQLRGPDRRDPPAHLRALRSRSRARAPSSRSPNAPSRPTRPSRRGPAQRRARLRRLAVPRRADRPRARPAGAAHRRRPRLSRLTRLTVLAGVPYVQTMFGRRRRYASAAEDEAYQTLRAWVELELRAEETRLLLLTSAVHSEGKTTATARLGQALAEAGYGVLLVSADLRRPTLHQLFDVELRHRHGGHHPGPDARGKDEPVDADRPRDCAAEPGRQRSRPRPRAARAADQRYEPGTGRRLLTTEVVHAFYDGLRRAGFDYVLIDGPPLLGIADSTVLAQEADDLLFVGRLDRLTLDTTSTRARCSTASTPAARHGRVGAPARRRRTT